MLVNTFEFKKVPTLLFSKSKSRYQGKAHRPVLSVLMATGVVLFHSPSHTSPNWPWPSFLNRREYKQSAFRIRIHPDPLHLAGSGSTSIHAPDPDPPDPDPPDPDPDPDPLRFLSSDPDPLKKALIWIRVAPKLFRVKSKTKCFCYLRNAFSKFWL